MAEKLWSKYNSSPCSMLSSISRLLWTNIFYFLKGQGPEEIHQRKDKCKFANVIKKINIQIHKERFSITIEGDFENSVKRSSSLLKPDPVWGYSENITLTKLSSSLSIIFWIILLPECMTSRSDSAFKDNRLYFCTSFCILRLEVKKYDQIRLENPEHHAQNCSSGLSICQHEKSYMINLFLWIYITL